MIFNTHPRTPSYYDPASYYNTFPSDVEFTRLRGLITELPYRVQRVVGVREMVDYTGKRPTKAMRFHIKHIGMARHVYGYNGGFSCMKPETNPNIVLYVEQAPDMYWYLIKIYVEGRNIFAEGVYQQ